jgi:hypothetical protein
MAEQAEAGGRIYFFIKPFTRCHTYDIINKYRVLGTWILPETGVFTFLVLCYGM